MNRFAEADNLTNHNSSRVQFLAAFNGVESPDDAFLVWNAHLDRLTDASLILSVPGESPFGKRLQTQFGASARLVSGFADDSYFFLNSGIYDELLRGRDMHIELSYLLSFDANAASHLRALFHGANSEAINDLKQLLSHFRGNRLNWQILPYLLETSVSDNPKTQTAVFETVLAVEKLKDIDTELFLATGRLKQLSNDEDLTTRARTKLNPFVTAPQPEMHQQFIHVWEVTYVCILKCAQLELELPGVKRATLKMKHLITFMAEDLQCMMITIVKIAWIWFGGSEASSIFNSVKRGNPKLLSRLKNIGWDIYHLLRLPQESISPAKPGSFLIPYFLTFDKALSKLMKVCGLRLCLIEKDFSYPYCVQANSVEPLLRFMIEQDRSLARFFTAEANYLRQTSENALDSRRTTDLRKRLEQELSAYERP